MDDRKNGAQMMGANMKKKQKRKGEIISKVYV